MLFSKILLSTLKNSMTSTFCLLARKEVATLTGHNFGITCVTFTPSMREIIAIGEPRDMSISVWAWPGKYMRAQNKFAGDWKFGEELNY